MYEPAPLCVCVGASLIVGKIRRSGVMVGQVHDEYVSTTTCDPISDEELPVDEGGLLPADHAGDEAKEGLEHVGEVRCPECDKPFKNNKSMFGHLRSHPNKGYKGATPPVGRKKHPSTSSADASPSSATDGNVRLARGLSAREIFGAFVLLILKHEDDRRVPLRAKAEERSTRSPESGKRKREPSDYDVEAAIERKGGSVRNNSPMDAESKGMESAERAMLMDTSDEHDAESSRAETGAVKKKKMTRRKVKDLPDQVVHAHEKTYECKTCKQVFPTYQALGGHMAGHNKDKQSRAAAARSQNRHDEEGKQDNDRGGADGEGEECECRDIASSSKGVRGEHVCKVCLKEWHSGQALGGHMRQHFEKKEQGSPPAPKTDAQACRRRDIDLNVKAPESPEYE